MGGLYNEINTSVSYLSVVFDQELRVSESKEFAFSDCLLVLFVIPLPDDRTPDAHSQTLF